MKSLFAVAILCVFTLPVFAQNATPPVELPRAANPLENISNDVQRLAKSVETLNKRMRGFFDTFSSNQGLQLSAKQQKLLLAFELLNRAEQRLAILQKLKIDLTEKQSSVNIQLGKLDLDLREESINRNIALLGTTNAEEVRENRRRALNKERTELSNLLSEIRSTLNETNSEIRQTDDFVKSIRGKLFEGARQELADF